jgi:hypothetical protein
MLTIVIMLKALAEMAGLFMLGQGLLWVFAGARREQNSVYKFFQLLTRPVMQLTRAIAPRFVLDQHIGLLAFFLVAVLWLVLTVVKVKLTLDLAAGV